MKQIFFSVMASLVIVNGAFASAELVKQKAQHIRDVNNQQQGITPAAPAAPGSSQAPAGTPAPPPRMSAAQQALVDRLENDLTAIKAGATVTDQQKTGLQTDMATLAKGANQPSKTNLAKLAADLATGLADKGVTEKDMAQLAKAINIVANCGPLTQARAQAYVTAAQGILKSSGVSDANIQPISADLKAIITEIQKSKPKLYQ